MLQLNHGRNLAIRNFLFHFFGGVYFPMDFGGDIFDLSDSSHKYFFQNFKQIGCFYYTESIVSEIFFKRIKVFNSCR